jgi:hypothetical protein
MTIEGHLPLRINRAIGECCVHQGICLIAGWKFGYGDGQKFPRMVPGPRA